MYKQKMERQSQSNARKLNDKKPVVEKKPYKNPNTEFFKMSALTNLLNAGLLILILIVLCYMLYAQTAEQTYLREVTEMLLKSLVIVQ